MWHAMFSVSDRASPPHCTTVDFNCRQPQAVREYLASVIQLVRQDNPYDLVSFDAEVADHRQGKRFHGPLLRENHVRLMLDEVVERLIAWAARRHKYST